MLSVGDGLIVGGVTELQGNTLGLGTATLDTATQAAFTISYTDVPDTSGTSLLRITATRSAIDWLWERTEAITSTAVPIMKLDADHRLNLFSSSNSGVPSIVLDPTAGQITINGSPVALSGNGWTASGANLFSAGNVGIGTSNPQAALDIAGTVKLNSDGSVSFANGASTVDASGNGYFGSRLGVGTVASDYPLELASTVGFAATRYQFSGNNPGDYWSNATGSMFYNDTYLQGGILAETNTYPSLALLQPDQLFFFSVGRNGMLFVTRNPHDCGTQERGNGQDDPGPIVFATGGIATSFERMRITAAGDIGIGTNEPQARLDVQGNARFSGAVRIEPQGDLTMGEFTSEPTPEQANAMQNAPSIGQGLSRGMNLNQPTATGSSGLLNSGSASQVNP